MGLFSRRQSDARRSQAESIGASFWSTTFDEAIRNKIFFSMLESVGDSNLEELASRARYVILSDRGKTVLVRRHVKVSEDFFEFVQTGSDEDVIDAIEGVHIAINQLSILHGFQKADAQQRFSVKMNTILREHRVAYEIVNGQMQPLNSAALTDLVYEPLAALFNNAKSFHKVESAYREAWKEFAEHRFSNAITDAATALQEMCESLGATQSQLSDQLKHLRNSGLLNSFDAPLVEAISKMISWAGGVRSQIGDTHRVNDTSIEDARFFLAVIGALIIRLAEANPSSNN